MIIFLSPHIDDVAFSASLFCRFFTENKLKIEIFNCFTITNFAPNSILTNTKEISELRKLEEESFSSFFNENLSIRFLDLPDAILRGKPIKRNILYDEDHELVKKICSAIRNTKCQLLIVPLGVGDHIDHIICQYVGINLYDSIEVRFYEDLPYSFNMDAEISEKIKEISERLKTRCKPEATIINGNNASVFKEQLIDCYDSQVNPEWKKSILSSLNIKGEVMWKL